MEVSDKERRLHREFVLRHIDTFADILAAEKYLTENANPCGCPSATPATIAHSRDGDNSHWGCVCKRIETLDRKSVTDESDCLCGDPLAGSDDPLDAVAAAVLAERDGVVEHYFDHRERALVLTLRSRVGSWEEILSLDENKLFDICVTCAPAYGLQRERFDRLLKALDRLADCSWLDELTFRDLPSVPYSSLQESLVQLPSISDREAWWLVLVAFDKPVWPAAPEIDRLLVDLGLLSPNELEKSTYRYTHLENELTPRQIPPLHRWLAAHSRDCCDDHGNATCEIRKFTLSYRAQQQATAPDGPAVIDLFAGAGGLSQGFAEAGCQISWAIDNDRYATDTYRLNHPEIPHSKIHCEDITELADSAAPSRQIPSADILVGGPPCQALSVAGYRSRLADDEDYSILDDPRTELYRQYVAILEKVRPTFLVMENVEGILSEIGDTGRRVIDDVEAALDAAGYHTDAELIDCSQLGLPQERDRVLVLGVRKEAVDDPDQIIQRLFDQLHSQSDSEVLSIRQALTNLPRIRRGRGAQVVAGRNPGRSSQFMRRYDIGKDTKLTYNHRAREHPMEKDQTLFDDVMEPGDTGWEVKYRKGREDLIDYNVGTEENPAFKDKYRMLHWNRPSPTIVAHLAKDANSFVLPDYYQYVRDDPKRADKRRNRGITPREAARLQSFPDSYLFLGPFTSQFRQIGNAVPPIVAQKVARILTQQLADQEIATLAEHETGYSQTAMTDD